MSGSWRTGLRFASWCVPCAFAVAAVMLLSCSNGEAEPPPDYVQADVTGSWDAVTFQVGTQPGWTRRSFEVDGAGAVEPTTFLDDLGDDVVGTTEVVLKVGGAGDLTRTIDGAGDTFRGVLARSHDLLAGVSTPAASSYALTVARKRDVAVTFAASDLQDRQIAIHTLRDSAAPADGWRYAVGSIDADGLVSVTATMGPAFNTTTVYAPPPPHGATLSVDADGFVSDGGQFEGFLTTDKGSIFAVHTDGGVRAITVIQLKGGSFSQADLAGTWAYSSLVGTNAHGWLSGRVAVDAAGAVKYLSSLDSAGSTELSPDTRFHLDPDGLMTNAMNPSYRGTLALDGEMYVRTQTHGAPPYNRFGLSVVLRR